MFTLKIKNTSGETFELTHNSQNYYITSIQGLTPPPTVVNTATAGTTDGTFFNSARVEQRNIVINIYINGDIETNRQQLYKIFPRKTECTIYFKNKNRDVKIEGYVEVLESDLFVQREQVQVSIICSRPYFQALTALYNELSEIAALFQFPFAIETTIPFAEMLDYPLASINNTGDAICGTIIELDFDAAITNIKIVNTATQHFFELDYEFQSNDRVIIDTNSGEMGVVLQRSGSETNMLNYVAKNSSWLKLLPGVNNFTFTVTTGNTDDVRIHFTTSLLYGGV